MQSAKQRPTLSRILYRRVLSFAVFAAVVGVAYYWIRDYASDRILTQARTLADILELPEDQRGFVRSAIEQAHPEAFAKSLDLWGPSGSRFKTDLYLNTLLDSVIQQARNAEQAKLADDIVEQRPRIQFRVDEQ